MAAARYESLLQLGDEPLYCEADPSEVLWEGSDDEKYPTSAHRKWAYEKAAVRFLEGAPLRLLSSTLQGPFDRASGWVNPWRSTKEASISRARTTSRRRTSRLLHHALAASQPSANRLPPASPCIEDSFAENTEVETRPGSICHLPSPESLDRPAHVPHHPYLDEDELAMVETWRSTIEVKPPKKERIRTPTKPSAKTPRKRRAETSSWLKRPREKRARTTGSPDDDGASMLVQNRSNTPSTRKLVSSQLWGDFSGEDELSVAVETSFRSPENSPCPSSDGKMPTRHGPFGSPDGILKAEDLSDDELSWPSGSAEKPRTWRAASARSQVSHSRQKSSAPKSSPSRRFLRNVAHSSPTKNRSKKKAAARLQAGSSDLEMQRENSFASQARPKKNKSNSLRYEVASSLPALSLSPRLPVKPDTLPDTRVDKVTTDNITPFINREAMEDEITDFTAPGTREEAVEEASSHDTNGLENIHPNLPVDASCETANNRSPAAEVATVLPCDEEEQVTENTFTTPSPSRPSIQRDLSDQAILQPPASPGNTTCSNGRTIDEDERLGPSQLDSQLSRVIDVVPCSQPMFDSSTLVKCVDTDKVSQSGEANKSSCVSDDMAKSVDDNEPGSRGPLGKSFLQEEMSKPRPSTTADELPEARLPSETKIVQDESTCENRAPGGAEKSEKKSTGVMAMDEAKTSSSLLPDTALKPQDSDGKVADEAEDPAPSLQDMVPVAEERTVEIVPNQVEPSDSRSPDAVVETEEKTSNVITDQTELSTSSLPDTAPVADEGTAVSNATLEIEEGAPHFVTTDQTGVSISSPGAAPDAGERTAETAENRAGTPAPCSPDMASETGENTSNAAASEEIMARDVMATGETERPTSCTATPILSDPEQVKHVSREGTPPQQAAAEVTPAGNTMKPPQDLPVVVPPWQQSPWRDTQAAHPDVTSHVQASGRGTEYESRPVESDVPGDDSMVALSQQSPWQEPQDAATALASGKGLSDAGLRIDALVHHNGDVDRMDVDEGQGMQSTVAEKQSPGALDSQDSLVAPSQQTPWQGEASQLNLRQEIDFIASPHSLTDGAAQQGSQQAPWQDEASQLNVRQEIGFTTSPNSLTDRATQQGSQGPWSRSFDSMRLVAHQALRMAGISFPLPFTSPSLRVTAENSQEESQAVSTRESVDERMAHKPTAASLLRPDQPPDTQNPPTPAPVRGQANQAAPTITLRAFRDFRSPSPGPSSRRSTKGESRNSLGPSGKKRGILIDFSSSQRYAERPRKRVTWGPLPCETKDGNGDSLSQTTTPMSSRSGRTTSPPPDQALADLPDNREDAFHGHFRAVKLHAKGHRHRILPSSSSSACGPDSPGPTAMADVFVAVDEMSKSIHADKDKEGRGSETNPATPPTDAEKTKDGVPGAEEEPAGLGGGETEEPDAVDAVLQDLDEYIELITVEADVARAKSERTATRSARRKERSFTLV